MGEPPSALATHIITDCFNARGYSINSTYDCSIKGLEEQSQDSCLHYKFAVL